MLTKVLGPISKPFTLMQMSPEPYEVATLSILTWQMRKLSQYNLPSITELMSVQASIFAWARSSGGCALNCYMTCFLFILFLQKKKNVENHSCSGFHVSFLPPFLSYLREVVCGILVQHESRKDALIRGIERRSMHGYLWKEFHLVQGAPLPLAGTGLWALSFCDWEVVPEGPGLVFLQGYFLSLIRGNLSKASKILIDMSCSQGCSNFAFIGVCVFLILGVGSLVDSGCSRLPAGLLPWKSSLSSLILQTTSQSAVINPALQVREGKLRVPQKSLRVTQPANDSEQSSSLDLVSRALVFSAISHFLPSPIISLPFP